MLGLKTKKKSGFVLALALILLLVITLVASTTMMVQRTQMRVGGNFSKVMNNFYVANTGVVRAQEVLQAWITTPGNTDFDGVLAYSLSHGGYLHNSGNGGTALYHIPYGDNTSGTVHNFYDVFVENNAGDISGGGSTTNDTDRRIVVTVRGYDSDGRAMTIKTYQESIATATIPTVKASTAVCGTQADVTYNAASVTDGYDWTPSASATCYTSSCAGTKDPTIANAVGPVVKEDASTTINLNGSTLDGTGSAVVTDATIQCSQWNNLATQLESVANRIARVATIGTTVTLGTAAVPTVTVIAPTGGTLHVTATGTIYGNGVLIIHGNMIIDPGAKFNYNGIIVVLNDTSSLSVQGTFDGFGAVVVNGAIPDPGVDELNFSAASKIKYSSVALQRAMNAIAGVSAVGKVYTRSWSENY
jgi:hypothetical protein